MTDRQFDIMFKELKDTDLLCWLGENISAVILKDRTSYGINNYADLIAMIEQEMYQKFTGRE